MIAIRPARPGDAAAIGAVHVAVWRSAYAGILPDAYLARLSAQRQAFHYDRAMRRGIGVHVAVSTGVVGFVTADRARDRGLGDGEVETLYVLDDFRERGVGRQLLLAGAAHLAARGCRSAYLWVLKDNPSRWFYQRVGGKAVAESTISVGGASVRQVAFVWDPIERLLAAAQQKL